MPSRIVMFILIILLALVSIGFLARVDFEKWPCHRVGFKGHEPHASPLYIWERVALRADNKAWWGYLLGGEVVLTLPPYSLATTTMPPSTISPHSGARFGQY